MHCLIIFEMIYCHPEIQHTQASSAIISTLNDSNSMLMPAEEESDLLLDAPEGGQAGKLKQKTPIATAEAAATKNCRLLVENPVKSTNHMAHIKPIVPHTLMGGNVLTKSNPA